MKIILILLTIFTFASVLANSCLKYDNRKKWCGAWKYYCENFVKKDDQTCVDCSVYSENFGCGGEDHLLC